MTLTDLPFPIGRLHFIGIGGIGMSGIAEVMHNLGFEISGSDANASAITQRLQQMGIPVNIGHRADAIEQAAKVVISSAVRPDNIELKAAREKGLPVVRRAEMLAELMRLKWSISIAGTHGKTTTTSLVGTILQAGSLDPTIINGGIINALGTNAKLGSGSWIVVESDESDGSFLKLPSTVVVVTNIDPEHMEHFKTFDVLKNSFRQFIQNIPFYGFAVVCTDHPVVQEVVATISDRRLISYGFNPQAEVRADDIQHLPHGVSFKVVEQLTGQELPTDLGRFELPMFGSHNVQNALAAITIGRQLGIAKDVIMNALADFQGVKRRFTLTGTYNGVRIIDDYGHHPQEIAAVLKAARAHNPSGKIVAVVQPHRYSRLSSLFDEFCRCFQEADAVIVADVYAAGELPIEGATAARLVQGLKDFGQRNVMALPAPDQLAEMVQPLVRSGDMVICLGAGTITKWAHALPEQLAQLPPLSEDEASQKLVAQAR